MRKTTTIIAFILCITSHGQDVETYFSSIRNDNAKLTAFIQQMPKGGDLHHHYSGSVYAETYLQHVIERNYFINRNTLVVMKEPPASKEWVKFSTLKQNGELAKYRQLLMQKWSVKDYNFVSYPSDKQFFETFPAFGIAADETLVEGLLELRNRAISENVSYLETMFINVPCATVFGDIDAWNKRIRKLDINRNEEETMKVLDSIYKIFTLSEALKKCAIQFNNDVVSRLHRNLKLDDDKFTIRYQAYVNRLKDPVVVFKDLVVAFEAVQNNPLMVGVNIVAPEDGEVSMNDYWLHMMMFKYCSTKYRDVKYAMHAGELTLGLVKPEELTWHIDAAVRIAGASRIGHGVDIPWEKNSYDLLRLMSSKPVPIEINLTSNEFILKVKDNQHPISLYREFNVPIVLSTDDAGVLRSNLTQQYVLLVSRYKDITYKEMKQIIYNSIEYSFIKEKDIKEKLKRDLDRRFMEFERKIQEIR